MMIWMYGEDATWQGNQSTMFLLLHMSSWSFWKYICWEEYCWSFWKLDFAPCFFYFFYSCPSNFSSEIMEHGSAVPHLLCSRLYWKQSTIPIFLESEPRFCYVNVWFKSLYITVVKCSACISLQPYNAEYHTNAETVYSISRWLDTYFLFSVSSQGAIDNKCWRQQREEPWGGNRWHWLQREGEETSNPSSASARPGRRCR